MEKRTFENLGCTTSLLGFGAMRLPLTQNGKIDEEQATLMLDTALDAGVNYLDTAYPYHNGESEPFIGKYLKKKDRKSLYLATKLPQWLVNSLEDAKRLFNEQLQRLDTPYFDFYLIHSIDKKAFDKMVELGVVAYLETLQKEGKIKHLGFSFHSIYEDFAYIANFRPWDFCQIQYNYLDTEDQAGDKGYALSEKLGIPLIVMEPIKGGSLANLAPELASKLQILDRTASSASFALRWVASHPNVKVILSGMSNLKQVEDNLKTFEPFVPLQDNEWQVLKEIHDIMLSRLGNGCTGCKYCMPCPFGVDIPGNFALWNKYRMFQDFESVKKSWENPEVQSTRPPVCTECGQCLPLCPQHINIPEDLKKVQMELSHPR
ncbi:MAG: aldo/keto reductase [Sphaerochaeta sp.]